MNLGRREKTPFPHRYKAFDLIRTHGRVYAIPQHIEPGVEDPITAMQYHPAVLSAATLEELKEKIDGLETPSTHPIFLGEYASYQVVRHRGTLYGVPIGATVSDWDSGTARRRAGVVTARTYDELEAVIDATREATPVEFAGWLPIYKQFGNCGQHPQFGHIQHLPPGYRFTCSEPPPPGRTFLASCAGVINHLFCQALRGLGWLWALVRMISAFFRPRHGVTIRSRWVIFTSMMRLVATLVGRGCRLRSIFLFLQSRNLQSQLLLGDSTEPVFLTSIPLTYGQRPWVIEIEDPTTLFLPMIHNGHTSHIDITQAPSFPIIKTLLEGESCKAILTHMKSTARMVGTLFGSEVIRQKVVYAPLGVTLPSRWQRHDPEPADAPIHLLFINSWSQIPTNFYLRGGLDVLEAFAILRERYPQLRLTMRSHLPPLDPHYHRIIEEGGVRMIDRFVSAEEMASLHAESHIFLLPAARIHIVSLLQAMSYGLAVVGSDGWGIEEYLKHEHNGLVVKGRYGKVSWEDTQAGLLREDYEPMCLPDPEVIQGLVEAISRLVEDAELRRRLGRTARHDVENTYNVTRWNQGMKAALDRTQSAEKRSAPHPDEWESHSGTSERSATSTPVCVQSESR